MDFIEIRCQEKCPYDKKRHCCFGEVDCSRLAGDQIVERHKCRISNEFIIIVIHKTIA